MFFQRMFHLATPEKKPTATTFFHNRYLACEMPIQSLQVVVMVLENGMPPSMLGTKRKLRKDALIRRLTPYWKMEAANIVLVPTVAALLVVKMSEAISIALMLAMAATAFLLLVGTIALRMYLQVVRGNRDFGTRVLPWLSAAQWPALILVILSIIGAGFELWIDGRFTASAITTMVLATLALLEYVNYFHVQLQNFDHKSDLKRLIMGGGLRESHLAKALRRFRKETGEN